MKRINILGIILILAASCTTIKEVPVSVNTRVLPLGDTVKLYKGSILYSLPQTGFEFTVYAQRTIQTAGPYHSYAEQFLGLNDVIRADQTIWSLKDVKVKSFTELDPDQYYIIESDGLIEINTLALKEAGLIMDINSSGFESRSYFSKNLENNSDISGTAIRDMGSDEYYDIEKDTTYRIVELDTAFVRIPYVLERRRQLTLEEQAENTARILLELREGRHLILTGEANVFPQDKAALDEINRLENEYISLFSGKSTTEIRTFKFFLIPDQEMEDKPVILFRFSPEDGVLEANDLSGRPVVVELMTNGKVENINLLENDAKAGSYDKLYYRVPEVVDVSVTDGRSTLGKSRDLVYQFGKIVTLPANYIIR
jgi:hypothetical protein